MAEHRGRAYKRDPQIRRRKLDLAGPRGSREENLPVTHQRDREQERQQQQRAGHLCAIEFHPSGAKTLTRPWQR